MFPILRNLIKSNHESVKWNCLVKLQRLCKIYAHFSIVFGPFSFFQTISSATSIININCKLSTGSTGYRYPRNVIDMISLLIKKSNIACKQNKEKNQTKEMNINKVCVFNQPLSTNASHLFYFLFSVIFWLRLLLFKEKAM